MQRVKPSCQSYVASCSNLQVACWNFVLLCRKCVWQPSVSASSRGVVWCRPRCYPSLWCSAACQPLWWHSTVSCCLWSALWWRWLWTAKRVHQTANSASQHQKKQDWQKMMSGSAACDRIYCPKRGLADVHACCSIRCCCFLLHNDF